LSINPNAGSGANCIWIYRENNFDYFLPNSPIVEINNLASLDPGDAAIRFNGGSWLRFAPNNQLFGSGVQNLATRSWNYVCKNPPSSVCPPSGVRQEFSIPLNVCGNGVQEMGEACDE
jgi:hypothetical protein